MKYCTLLACLINCYSRRGHCIIIYVDGGYSDLGKISVAPISTLDVELAIANTKPSAKTLAGQYEKWQLNFESC